ncbi:hypothetical protein [Spirosoma sp.]|uniref:hypothetical protein n=1 Tax=Spirosoma sp. TaxID=1899569 RepID=UPI003B3BC5BD
MAINDHAANLVNITVKAFNEDVTSISPTDGLSLIDSWLNFLHSDAQTDNSVNSTLSELRSELQSGQLDGAHIQQLLGDLSNQVKQLANSADADDKPQITTLSEALDGFSQQVNGESGPAKTGGQAPMTSTVGGESSNSGVGASPFGTSGDDLSGRNGGIISNSTPDDVDMDDTTGSDGGPQKDRSSDDDTGDSSYSSESELSRSDTSRIGGPGVSGGTGDTSTTQSGGRSQY